MFASPTGQPLNPNTDYHEWKRLLKEAGLREARLHDARHTAATVLLLLDVPERTVMSLMGWSSTDMAARYQHVTDTIRQDVARQVDVLIWQARDSSTGEGTVPVSRVSLTAILRLAELGLVHADEAVMADAQEAIEQIRAVLADGVDHSAPDTDVPGSRGTSTEEEKRNEPKTEPTGCAAINDDRQPSGIRRSVNVAEDSEIRTR